MQVEVIADAPILIPNKEHKNFTSSGQVIKLGSILDGEERIIKGERRGQPFDYKLFLTNNQQFIHIKKIKPMTTTEVTLGADAKQTPTIIDMPSSKKLLTPTIIGTTLLGAGAGYYYSAKMKKMDKKKVLMFAVGGALLGFFAGKYVEKRKGIRIKTSK